MLFDEYATSTLRYIQNQKQNNLIFEGCFTTFMIKNFKGEIINNVKASV